MTTLKSNVVVFDEDVQYVTSWLEVNLHVLHMFFAAMRSREKKQPPIMHPQKMFELFYTESGDERDELEEFFERVPWSSFSEIKNALWHLHTFHEKYGVEYFIKDHHICYAIDVERVRRVGTFVSKAETFEVTD